MEPPIAVPIGAPVDVERARWEARRLVRALGFDVEGAESVVLATVELATNLLRYAQGGEIRLAPVAGPRGVGVQLESRDAGPGIADIDQALSDGFSTTGGLGSGLPAVRRLMQTFVLESDTSGTRIVACRWPAGR
jgi:serine/threonine-protein kinase RsbT